MRRGKKYKQAKEKLGRGKAYNLEEAISELKECAYAKFDETVEMSLRLGVDPKHADQMVRGTALLPNGTGKKIRVLVLTKGEKETEAKEAGADFIGANCGRGIEDFVSICRRMRDCTHLPLWIKPNAGLPEYVDGKTIYRTTPENFSENVPALVEAGATFIGGCCGTTPEFIRELVRVLGQ